MDELVYQRFPVERFVRSILLPGAIAIVAAYAASVSQSTLLASSAKVIFAISSLVGGIALLQWMPYLIAWTYRPMLILTNKQLWFKHFTIPWGAIAAVSQVTFRGKTFVGICLSDESVRLAELPAYIHARLRKSLADSGANMLIPSPKGMSLDELTHLVDQYAAEPHVENGALISYDLPESKTLILTAGVIMILGGYCQLLSAVLALPVIDLPKTVTGLIGVAAYAAVVCFSAMLVEKVWPQLKFWRLVGRLMP